MTDYDAAAASYDAIYSDRLSRAENIAVQRMTRRFIDGADVLDVGCGTGLGLTLGSPRSYLGVDASAAMIAEAKRAHGRGDGVDFATLPAELLQPPGESFDTVLCLWAFPHFERPVEILGSWFSCLRPGGNAIILSWDARHQPTVEVDDGTVPVPALLLADTARMMSFRVQALGGLRGRESGRRIARALPLPLAASLIQTGAHAPQFLLRLRKPGVARVTPEPVRRPSRPFFTLPSLDRIGF